MSLRIRVDSFAYRNGGESILRALEIAFPPGERVCLLGPSGGGKSTLLRLLMGLVPGQGTGHAHTAGWVELDGTRHPLGSWGRHQNAFSLVPQAPLLFPWRTVAGNLRAALPRGLSRAEGEARIQALLGTVGLAREADSYPWSLSQGQAARVAFARALLVPSRCMLLDEPFAALDAHTRRGLQSWLVSELATHGLPCLFVTHDVREALTLGTRILVLGGKPASLVANFHGFANTPDWEREVEGALTVSPDTDGTST